MNKEFENILKSLAVESGVEGRVASKILERAYVGVQKYGITVEDRSDLTTNDWLTHLQEELMDAAVYIEKLKILLSDEVNEANSAKIPILYSPSGMNEVFPEANSTSTL